MAEQRIYKDTWEKGKLLSRGEFGEEVHQVLTDLKIECAAKTIRLPFFEQQKSTHMENIKSSMISTQQLCRLRHENIMRFYESKLKEEESTVVVLMELVTDKTLSEYVHEKLLAEDEARILIKQICDALNYLHSETDEKKCVVHRQINAQTIVISPDGRRAKLIDFGLAVMLVSANAHHLSVLRGDTHYMAPELFLTKETEETFYSCASDIWAFGCVIYRMVSGEKPYSNCKNMLKIGRQVQNQGAPPLPEGCSNVMKDFYAKCTVHEKEKRKTAAELMKHNFLVCEPSEYQNLEAQTDEADSERFGLPFLKRWDTVCLIGIGGFGEVHEVLTDKGIRCAAKTIKLPVQLGDELDSVKRVVERAVQSERNLYRLQHDNIVRFLHIAQPEPATVVLFMELLDGCSLERFLNKKPLDELTVRDFSKQICSALLYMHSQQPPVIHRDINCTNIIVLESRRLKLIDFGLSIKLEQSVSHISGSTQTPKGTLHFMAPELLGAGESDSVQYSRESDIWAFGCSVFQMVSGARPFANARNFFQVGQLIDSRGAPALPDGSSAELEEFYSLCTAKNRSERKLAAELMRHEFLTGNGSSVRESMARNSRAD